MNTLEPKPLGTLDPWASGICLPPGTPSPCACGTSSGAAFLPGFWRRLGLAQFKRRQVSGARLGRVFGVSLKHESSSARGHGHIEARSPCTVSVLGEGSPTQVGYSKQGTLILTSIQGLDESSPSWGRGA